MSGITMYTVLIIQNNGDDVTTSFGQDPKTKKWRGFIHLYRSGRFHSEVLSTKPIFDSSQLAEQHMKDLIEDIRKLDLSTVSTFNPELKEENTPANTCSACGYSWETDQKDENCPRCEGHGRADPNCTCKNYSGTFGIKIDVPIERNPECPIHTPSAQT